MIVVGVGQRDADRLYSGLERTDRVPELNCMVVQICVHLPRQAACHRMRLNVGKRLSAHRLESRPAFIRIARIFPRAITGSQRLNVLGVLFAVGNQTLMHEQRRQCLRLGNCCVKRGLVLFFVRVRGLALPCLSRKQGIQILLCVVASCLEQRRARFRACLQGKIIVVKSADTLNRLIKRGGVQPVGGNQLIDLCLQRSSCSFNGPRTFCGGQCFLGLFARTIFRRKRCPKTAGLVSITVVAITGLIPVCFVFAGYRCKQTCKRFCLLIGKRTASGYLNQDAKDISLYCIIYLIRIDTQEIVCRV